MGSAKFQAIRGTHDILPGESELFQKLEHDARALFHRFGFQEIRTPTFESLDLFHRSIGETTDIVEKEMYVFEDRGGRRLALRPEGTAGVVRAFVEHHLDQTRPFCKLFYIGSMFRAERPQAGRYREFWQIGAEYFGNPSPAADAELLLMVQSLYEKLGLPDVTLKVNSLGDAECRPVYRQALLAAVEKEKDTLCEDCQRRIAKNPLRVLDCKIDGPRMQHLPTVDQYWCGPCREHFETVQTLLKKSGGVFTVVPRLVRGLDYYSRTVFEVTTTALGAQDALAAGGRYDKLVKEIGGPDMPALGFALGMERTVLALKAHAEKKGATVLPAAPRLFVAAMGASPSQEAFQLLQELRMSGDLAQRGVVVEGGFFDKKLGTQLTMADRLGSVCCLILGEEELQRGEVTLKLLKASTQERVPRKDLVARLLRLVNGHA